jgi:hypothetical protein
MKQTLRSIRAEFKRGARASYLLTRQSAKTVKGEKYGILTGVLYLSPANESGYDFCPNSTPGCRSACLGKTSGRMRFDASRRARILRSLEYMLDRSAFIARLEREVRNMVRQGKKKGMRVFIRLNGSSDIPWIQRLPRLFSRNPTVQFYDYTKGMFRMDRESWPANYHCTFSRSEDTTEHDIATLTRNGYNVAIVFNTLPDKFTVTAWPDTYPVEYNIPVVNGDITDARPDDVTGVIVGLSAKGKAKKDTTGFVVR